MKRVRWLTSAALAAVHEELIARYGGSHGVRAPDLLESALARPKHLAAYGRDVTVARLAAAYGWRLLRNGPFVDGNKRAALAVMIMFLELNKWELTCGEAEETAMVLDAAAAKITEHVWSAWVARVARRPR